MHSMIHRVSVAISVVALVLAAGCSPKNAPPTQASSPEPIASGPGAAAGQTGQAGQTVQSVSQSPITSADLNKGMSEKQKAILLSRKNK